MGVLDDVLCNNDLFGKHKGETRHTQSLNSVFPGSTYEITPSGRLELLGYTYEDRSDPNAQGWERFLGWMTPVFTGQRRDMDLHGWVEFPGFGRAKFTDGTMIAFETDSDQSATVPVQERTDTPSVLSPNMEAPIYMQDEALGTLRVNGRKVEATCLRCRHFITNDWGARKVLERFWAHQLLEHHVPPDLIGVEGLEYVGAAGIRLAVQIVVVSRPRS
jgi:hypothetical protein